MFDMDNISMISLEPWQYGHNTVSGEKGTLATDCTQPQV